MYLILAVVGFSFPLLASAAVTINEVAWMGSDGSANDEWIELFNNGSAVTVDGWELRDGMNLSIELSGTITGGAYAVLERTDDESAPGSAFLIYTGALSNTGATLTLYDAVGNVMDQVAGGENWVNIGGDNTTKETAQYTNGGWVTAAATPGMVNVASVPDSEDETEAESDDESDQTDSNDQTNKKDNSVTSGETIRLILPDVTLQLTIDGQKVAYVNQPVTLTAEPSGIGDTLLDSLQYMWNFGDATTATGKQTVHVYEYPGEYVVTLYAGYKRQEQMARHTITVLPVTFSITRNEAGDVQVHNDAKYEVDLSGYQLLASGSFVFPDRSILLPGATITIPKDHLLARSDDVVRLHDQAKQLVAHSLAWPAAGEGNNLTTQSTEVSVQPSHSTMANSPAEFTFVDQTVATVEPVVATDQLSDDVSSRISDPVILTATALEADPNPNKQTLALAGFGGFVVLGVLLLVSRRWRA